MDDAVSIPPPIPRPIDRRVLVSVLSLAVAGASGVALAEAGVPVTAASPYQGPAVEIASVRRTLAALANGYDTLGPRKVSAILGAAETAMLRVFGEGGMTPGQEREATVIYGRLLAMGARADVETGQFGRAERKAKLAVMTAVGAGDEATAGRALTTISCAMRITGSPLQALASSHRAHGHARSGPAAVEALLAEAQASAQLHRLGADAVVERVVAAEKEHAKLNPEQWGTPGYSLRTYHPVDLKAFGASALIDVGLYSEAMPRLEEAADAVASADGLRRVYVWLLSARAALGNGDLDSALDYATVAMASADPRPTAWVARIIGEIDRQSGGKFAELVAQAAKWGFPFP